MRRAAILLVAVATLTVIPAVAVGAPRSATDYHDTWTATDPADGSMMTLTIDSLLNFDLFDDESAVFCSGNSATATGSGTISRNGKVTVDLFVICNGGAPTTSSGPITFKTKPDGTMKDSGGAVWTRIP